MAVIKPRTRVVFFRVSEEEFQEMEIACSKVGARSISDFARVAARRCLKETEIDHLGILLEKLATFEQTLDELQMKVEKAGRNGFQLHGANVLKDGDRSMERAGEERS